MIDDSILSVTARLVQTTVWLSLLIVVPIAFAFFVLVPFAFNTLHLQDTLFFADIGWRVYHGLTPALDFGHFYGGVTAQYIAWAFALFGPTMKAIDYGFVLAMVTAMALIVVLAYRRLSTVSLAAVLLLVAACVLARVPLEQLTPVQQPTAAHSFFYNRFAISLGLPICVFALIPTRIRLLEIGAGVLAGVALYALMLTKPTFAVFAPFILIALVIGRRWAALAGTLIGLGVALVVLDPGAAKWQASLAYAVVTQSDNTSIVGMLFKSVAVFAVHPLALFLLLVVMAMSMVAKLPEAGRLVLASLFVAAGFTGMVATMGWLNAIGQQALPLMAVLTLVFAERIRTLASTDNTDLSTFEAQDAAETIVAPLQIIAGLCVLAFSLPNLAHTAMSGGFALTKAGYIESTGTVMDSYLGWNDGFRHPDGYVMGPSAPWEEEVAAAKAHMLKRKNVNVGVEYVLLIDAIRLLQTIPDIAQHGVAGDMAALSFALGAPPVAEFPPWVHIDVPELAAGRPIPKAVDYLTVKIIDTDPTWRIKGNLKTDFELCARSELMLLYRRSEVDPTGCAFP